MHWIVFRVTKSKPVHGSYTRYQGCWKKLSNATHKKNTTHGKEQDKQNSVLQGDEKKPANEGLNLVNVDFTRLKRWFGIDYFRFPFCARKTLTFDGNEWPCSCKSFNALTFLLPVLLHFICGKHVSPLFLDYLRQRPRVGCKANSSGTGEKQVWLAVLVELQKQRKTSGAGPTWIKKC